MSNVIVAVKNQDKKTTSMELIFLPIVLMIVIGVIFNNFNASGLQATGVLNTTQFTRTDNVTGRTFCILGVDPNCNLTVNPVHTGCALSIQNCNASNLQTITFLNSNSPFTLLLQGNLIGFFSTAFNSGESQNNIYSGFTICIPLNRLNLFNATGNDIHNFICEAITAVNSTQFKPVTGTPMNATANGGNNSIWTVTGCKYSSQGTGGYPCVINGNSDGFATWNGTNSVSTFYAFYIRNGSSVGEGAICYPNGLCATTMSWAYHTGATFTCPNTNRVQGININATTYYCLLPQINPITPNTTASDSLPNIFSGLSFLFGVILFFAGIGLAITSALIGFTINEQGTKLAQVFGIAIVIWSFITSEFGWIFVTNFSMNGDLIGTIISLVFGFVYIVFTVMFFVGTYWRLFSLE